MDSGTGATVEAFFSLESPKPNNPNHPDSPESDPPLPDPSGSSGNAELVVAMVVVA